MKPELAVSNPSPLLQDVRALRAVVEAVRFQLEAWDARTPDAMGEDEFADLQNDIGYLGALLHGLEAERDRLLREEADSVRAAAAAPQR